MQDDERLRISHDGSVTAVREGLKSRLAGGAGDYRVLEGPGALLLQRMGGDGKARGRVLMAGELVNRMTVVEIISVVTSTNWRGELHINTPLGRRVLQIDQGALKYALSSIEQEHLGEVLIRGGVVARERLMPVLAERKPDQRLGELLIHHGLITQEELFSQLKVQIETIFYGALLEEKGSYWFVAPPDDAPPPPTTVHLPVQALLMEGVQRLDEMALYRERIPHNRVFAAATGTAPLLPKKAEALEPFMLEVLERCDGSRNVDELARATGLGEFPVLKALYNLLRAGLIKLRRGPSLDEGTAKKLVRQYNDLARDIFVVVATYASMEGASRAVSEWLAQSPHAQLLGEKVDFDGTLDGAAVFERLTRSALEDPMAALHQSLHELSAFALFRASMGLPRHEEQALARHVNLRLKQMRL